jgi:hypothetical protein
MPTKKGMRRVPAMTGARKAYDDTKDSVKHKAAAVHKTTKKGMVRAGAKGVAGSRLAFDATKQEARKAKKVVIR